MLRIQAQSGQRLRDNTSTGTVALWAWVSGCGTWYQFWLWTQGHFCFACRDSPSVHTVVTHCHGFLGGDPLSHYDVFTDLPLVHVWSLFGTKLPVKTDFLCRCCVCVCVWQTDYYYEYTECDSTGSRWRVAIPQRPGACAGLPEPVKGTECSKLE